MTEFLKSNKNTHLLQRLATVFLREEVDISGGDNTHQFAAHFSCLCDRNTRETMSNFGLKHIPDCVAWTHNNWVCNKTLFEPLEANRNQNNYFPLYIGNVAKKQQKPKHTTQKKSWAEAAEKQ